MEYLKDKYILLPFVKKTDFLYTKLGITPNTITLFNAYIISSLIFYYWYKDNFFYSLILLFLRNLLDGSDGYIARKYKLYSKVGDIYDHMSDCVFIGLYFNLSLYKVNVPYIYIIPICNIIIMTNMVLQFSGNFDWVSKSMVGAGGSYESYCTFYYLLGHFLLYIIWSFNINIQ